MIRWVVTGPIGAGKSAVSAYLVGKGAALVDGDQLGHLVLAQPEVVRQVCAEFGRRWLLTEWWIASAWAVACSEICRPWTA